MRYLTCPRTLFLLLAVFALALLTSGFIMQYGFGVLPCQMCWWQRYAHMAIAAGALLGLVPSASTRLSDYRLPMTGTAFTLILAASLAGFAVAAWQYAAQHNMLPWPQGCTSSTDPTLAAADALLAAMQNTRIVPCDKETFRLLGLSLAGWNLPAMLAATVLSVIGINNLTKR
ncbi:MAG: disulfide bond formation protein B [Proteobacteria bacterium]|nr:disulfide bond formation protein B [Pseudomonadota bacterium]